MALNPDTAAKYESKAIALFDRYGWEEFCEQREVTEIKKQEYGVLRRFMLDIESYFNDDGKLMM